MIGNWTFAEQTPLTPSGSNLAEPNFTREKREIANIFLREFDQNVLDARLFEPDGSRKPARIEMRLIEILEKSGEKLLESLIEPVIPHLVAAGHDANKINYANPRVLVIEEFGTLGLTGRIDFSHAKGEDERWSNFWFGENKKSKTGRSLGRQGQGKITYHVISAARCVFALTRRADDGESLLFGKCIVQGTHEIEGQYYLAHAYWHGDVEPKTKTPLPISNQSDNVSFTQVFGLRRKNESGTSWVIPFVPESFSRDALIREFVRDFFFSVISGDITANICGEEINRETIISIFDQIGLDEPSKGYFEFLVKAVSKKNGSLVKVHDDWQKSERIIDGHFADEQVSEIRRKFSVGEDVSMRMPITITRIDNSVSTSYVDVHLRRLENVYKTEELYVRSGLCIADEQHLKNHSRNAYGLVLAGDDGIAEFLGYCEAASHLNWNAREKDARDRYRFVKETLGAVRKSLPSVYRFLAGSDSKVFEDAFIDLLAIPSSDGMRKGSGNIKNQKESSRVDEKVEIEPRDPAYFRYQDNQETWSMRPGVEIKDAIFPVNVKILFSYDRIAGSGNPWVRYHPFDFDLGDTSAFKINVKDASVTLRRENVLELEILSPQFFVDVNGFSVTQRLLSKVEY